MKWNGRESGGFNDFDFLCKFPGQYKYTDAGMQRLLMKAEKRNIKN